MTDPKIDALLDDFMTSILPKCDRAQYRAMRAADDLTDYCYQHVMMSQLRDIHDRIHDFFFLLTPNTPFYVALMEFDDMICEIEQES